MLAFYFEIYKIIDSVRGWLYMMKKQPVKFLESRRYIGSKAKLANWIASTIVQNTKDINSFFDVFAGTGIVSKEMSKVCDTIILNDFLYSNYVVYQSFFNSKSTETIKKCLGKYRSLNVENLKDNYFSTNFGGKYFSQNNAKLIGYIREDIENNKNILTIQEYYHLITVLMYGMDKIANTVGHYDAYIKKPIKDSLLSLDDIESIDVKSLFIYNEDSNILAPKIVADIAYIDPPYNSRQYGRFYHIWDNVAEWKKPALFGSALKPVPHKISKYCQSTALKIFEDLINKLNVKYIVVSYNNTYNSKSSSSKNKISLEEIKDVLQKRGSTKVFTHKHPYFNAGKTDFPDHQELLFITKVENK